MCRCKTLIYFHVDLKCILGTNKFTLASFVKFLKVFMMKSYTTKVL